VRCSMVIGHVALWHCSWRYTARLGKPPREALSSLSGACADGWHGDGCRFKFQSNLVWDSIKSMSNFCFQF
jgi:hypothetical protein